LNNRVGQAQSPGLNIRIFSGLGLSLKEFLDETDEND
jgi:hypothetical protein